MNENTTKANWIACIEQSICLASNSVATTINNMCYVIGRELKTWIRNQNVCKDICCVIVRVISACRRKKWRTKQIKHLDLSTCVQIECDARAIRDARSRANLPLWLLHRYTTRTDEEQPNVLICNLIFVVVVFRCFSHYLLIAFLIFITSIRGA